MTASIASLTSSVVTLQSFSGNVNARFTTLGTYTGSVDTRFTTLETYTGSINDKFTEVGIVTASLITSASLVSSSVWHLHEFSSSENSKAATLATYTGSLESRFASLATISGSLILSASAVSSSVWNLHQFSASVTASLIQMTASIKDHEERVAYLEGIGGITGGNPLTQLHIFSASAKISIADLEFFTTSANTRLSNLETTTASLNTSITNLNTFSASENGKATTLATYTGSVEGRFTTLGNLTGSNAIRLTKLEESTASLNSYTSSLKTAITIVGSDVTLNGNLTVAGATTQINSTTLNIGDNIIQLNGTGATNGGLVVRDATASTTVSGSLLWDTANDRWIAGPLGSEAKVLTDGMGVISGSGQLGNYETTGRGIVSGSSQIVPLLPIGTVSGSSQVIGILSSLNTFSGSALTRLTALEVETTNLETFSSSALTRLTALEVETLNLEGFTSSINTTIKTQLNANTVISGSSQVNGLSNAQLTNSSITIAGTSVSLGGSITAATILNGTNVISSSTQIVSVLPTGVVSGSSQIDLTATTNYASGILTRLNVVGVISGSSQISLGSAAGNIALATQTTGDYVASLVQGTGVTITNNSGENATPTIAIGQAVGTSANVQFSSIGVGTTASGTAGEIRATGDITAYYSSDIRLKENIQPIPNALEKVNQISGNTYVWKEGYDEVHSHKGNDVGVIAQEIEAILPQIVTNRDTGFKAVQYEKIIPLLIEAIKELSSKVDRLENK
jgi:hypothetical protein